MPAKLPYPPEVVRAFQMHRYNAGRRSIPFLFTIAEWWAWWQIDDRWARRGVGRDKLVMARKGDIGPYSTENVYAATHQQNVKDTDPAKVAANLAKAVVAPGHASALRVKGGAHPRSRGVITEAGRFANATQAAEHHGITRQYAAKKAREGIDGWTYT